MEEHSKKHTLSAHGATFFQFCCCVSFLFVVAGDNFWCYLPTYVRGLGKIHCLLESGYKVGTYRTHDLMFLSVT
jgi:hypothetical protein